MKILVVGAGSIGRRHATNAAELADCAIFDKNADLVKQADLPAFDSLDEALKWKPDGVVVATPHTTHIEIASRAADVGASILIEKPISNSTRGLDSFFNKIKKKNVQAFTVCNMRFHPAITQLRKNLERIGKPYFARAQYGNYLPAMRPGADYKKLYSANREQGGGVIFDVIHEYDYLSWILGEAEAVSCAADKLSSLDIDVEDYAQVNIRHKNAVRSEVHVDFLQQCKRRGCEIAGENGTLVWLSEGKNPEHCTVKLYETKTGKWEILLAEESLDTALPYKKMMQTFIENIRSPGAQPDLLKAIDSVHSLGIALAAHESAAAGSAFISLDEPYTRASAYKD